MKKAELRRSFEVAELNFSYLKISSIYKTLFKKADIKKLICFFVLSWKIMYKSFFI